MEILTLTQFKTRIADCFSSAKSYKSTSTELQARLHKHVYDEVNRTTGKDKRTVYSSFVRGYVAGCIETQRDLLYRNEFDFLYMLDGVLYCTGSGPSIHKLTEEIYKANRGRELNTAVNGHYWKNSTKPFFVGESPWFVGDKDSK